MAAAAESTIVFLPRFTTVVGAAPDLITQPLDVSQFASAQFQVWVGAKFSDAASDPALTLYLEESLDCEHWVLGASAPEPVELKHGKSKLFSYGFRLRWFRLRLNCGPGTSLVTCWAEGILR